MLDNSERMKGLLPLMAVPVGLTCAIQSSLEKIKRYSRHKTMFG
jgi:hypothetical protein